MGRLDTAAIVASSQHPDIGIVPPACGAEWRVPTGRRPWVSPELSAGLDVSK